MSPPTKGNHVLNNDQIATIFEAFGPIKSHDEILTSFVYKKLLSTIDGFVIRHRIEDRYLCGVDCSNLIGDLALRYSKVAEQYERDRWSDCYWNRVHYIFKSLRQEVNRLLKRELLKFKHDRSGEKYEITISPERWENMDMDTKYCEPNLDEFQFDIDKWTKNEREFALLVFENNNLKDIAELMDMSYSSAKRIKERLRLKLGWEVEVE